MHKVWGGENTQRCEMRVRERNLYIRKLAFNAVNADSLVQVSGRRLYG